MPAVNAVALAVTQDQEAAVHRRLEVGPLVEPAWLELPGNTFILKCDVEGFTTSWAAGELRFAECGADGGEFLVVFIPRSHVTILVHRAARRNAPRQVGGLLEMAKVALAMTE